MISVEPVSMIALLPKEDQIRAIEINNILEEQITTLEKNINAIVGIFTNCI